MPATSERNFTPSSTARPDPRPMIAGVGFDGQMVRPVGSALTEIERHG